MKEKLKDLVRSIWRSRIYQKVLFKLDVLAFRLAKPSRGYSPYTLFLAPPTGENIGDQAMFDSVLENTPGRIVTVVTGRNFVFPQGELASRVSIAVLPGLIHRPPFIRFGVVRRYGAIVKGADALVAPGADTIDGAHPHASLARLSLIRLGLRANIHTTLQGFSWMDGVSPTVLKSVAELAGGGAAVCPRDPVSDRRLHASQVHPTVLAADLAFASQKKEPLPAELAAYIERLRTDGTQYVLFNASGLIHRNHNLFKDYSQVLAALHEQGLKVVFTPHVHRGWDDDFAMARMSYQRMGHPDDFVVDSLLTPAQIRTLASNARLTVSGRMHLAILSLGQGIPVVCLATRGKVEGLFEMFGLDDCVVEPRLGCGRQLADTVLNVHNNYASKAALVSENLPKVLSLAMRNFSPIDPG